MSGSYPALDRGHSARKKIPRPLTYRSWSIDPESLKSVAWRERDIHPRVRPVDPGCHRHRDRNIRHLHNPSHPVGNQVTNKGEVDFYIKKM